MECRCDTVAELYGPEAEDYAGEHLVRGDTDTERMTERFSCPETGRHWELTYPEGGDREPGQARLRAVT